MNFQVMESCQLKLPLVSLLATCLSTELALLGTGHLMGAFSGVLSKQCHLVGIIQYLAFSDGLLLLHNMHLSFLHVFP